MAGEPIIKIEHLTKHFGGGRDEVAALEDINITIHSGEIFGVIGLSGAGKSTLVRCVNLLERPTAGTVWVDGREMTALSPKELREARKSIGMIFQSFNLLMQRTALENVCFPLELAGASRKEAEARSLELLELVDLKSRAGAYPAQLSGGQKQRVAIARTLATNPKVLLCDEATSALDPKTTRDILRLVRDINQRLGITVVVITHDMKVIEEICHRVAILDHGRVAEEGTVEEVFSRPRTEAGRRLVYPDGGAGGAAAAELGPGGRPGHPGCLQRRHRLPAPHRLPGHRLRREGQHPGGGHPEHRRPGLRHHAPGAAGGRGPGRQGPGIYHQSEGYYGRGGARLP